MSLRRCPVCDREVAFDGERFAYHDFVPPCRALCPASLLPPYRAEAIAKERGRDVPRETATDAAGVDGLTRPA